MKREECERAIAEHLIAIRRLLLEYNPEAEWLHLSIGKSKNGNDNGEWDCAIIDAFNAVEDKVIGFDCHKDIKDDKYWACVSAEEDTEDVGYRMKEGRMLSDGFLFSSETWKE